MVDRADLGRVNSLYEEARQIVSALANFDNGGRIVSMTISPSAQDAGLSPGPGMVGPPVFMGMSVTVSTVSIDYPAQMVSSIRTALEQRRTAILAELAGLGITGMESEPQPAAAAAPAAAAVGPPPRPGQPPRR